MFRHDRAAQLSPFAALTGCEAAVEKTARLTDRLNELDEGEKTIDQLLPLVQERLLEPTAGGAYVGSPAR